MWIQENLENENGIDNKKWQKEPIIDLLTKRIKKVFNPEQKKVEENFDKWEKSDEWEKTIFIMNDYDVWWYFEQFQCVPIEIEKWGLIIFGTIIDSKQKKWMNYLTIRYNDEKWKVKKISLPEGQLIWMDESYKITKDYYEENNDKKIKYVRVPYKNTVVAGIVNWKNEKWEYVIQIIGDKDNSIQYYSKETLDEYNMPKIKFMNNTIRINNRQKPHLKDILKRYK